jgi:hypothetical protein
MEVPAAHSFLVDQKIKAHNDALSVANASHFSFTALEKENV